MCVLNVSHFNFVNIVIADHSIDFIAPSPAASSSVGSPAPPLPQLSPPQVPPDQSAPRIPLPHNGLPLPSARHPRIALADRLFAAGLISRSSFVAVTSSPDSLKSTLAMVREWASSSKAGHRAPGSEVFNTLSPDQALFPGATQSPFRLDNLSLLLGPEQAETMAYLIRSFTQGFDIGVGPSHCNVEYPNKPSHDPVANDAISDIISSEAALGRITRRTAGIPVFVSNPIRPAPKNKYGRPTVPPRFRLVINPSRGSALQDSINSEIAD